MPRLLALLAVAAVAACAVPGTREPAVPAPLARRVVLLSFDGGADWIVDRLIERGTAPQFAALAREGAAADSMVSVIPSLTAVAHGTLWTGAFPRLHGVTDNNMPMTPTREHTLLERRSGFLSDVLRAEPIWSTAAAAGRRVLVVQATGGYPFRRVFPDRLTQFDVYADELLRNALVRGQLQRGAFRFRIGDTNAELRRASADALTLRVASVESELSLSRRRYSPPLPVQVDGREGLVRVGLVDYDAATGRVLLLRGDVSQVHTTHPEQLAPFLAEAGITFGEIGAGHYTAGRFGPTLAEGGSGDAERRLVSATHANQEYFDGGLRYAARQPWDLLLLYVPNLDVAGHALVGMLDPDTPGHDAALAERVWPFYEEMFKRCADDFVASIRELLPDATVVIGSDHGVDGNSRQWFPNAVLRAAGLLHEVNGTPDLARTRALFLYGHGGGIFINSTGHKGGIVEDADREAVTRAVTAALLSARDPEGGGPLVRAVVSTDVDGEALGIGGPVAPDIYFDSTPGYYANATFGAPALTAPVRPSRQGNHGPFPTRRRLHGIFYAAGPGVKAGARPGLIRQVDVAPTVARLLGIPPPAQSVGRALPLD